MRFLMEGLHNCYSMAVSGLFGGLLVFIQLTCMFLVRHVGILTPGVFRHMYPFMES